MSQRLILLLVTIINCFVAVAQVSDSVKEIRLPSVIVKAFGQNKKLQDIPAAVSYIGQVTLNDFNNYSIVSAMNAMPGIRMEERSPGSFRLNIRGSSLRSPFGVRNVKVYYNDIPYTDPGGNTYLNQLGYYNYNNIEIIKGANNSIYGAGTGGVMLIESIDSKQTSNISAETTLGSDNYKNNTASFTYNSGTSSNKVTLQNESSDGYRQHSSLKRNVYSWDGLFKTNSNGQLKTTFLMGDLFYQTPGALTKTEYDNNPKMARPSVGNIPGAIAANTSIHQQLYLAGITYTQPVTKRLSNKTTVYGYFAELRNPAISSYQKSSEPNFGGRTVFTLNTSLNQIKIKADLGYEYQKGYTSVTASTNKAGNPDSLIQYDEINLMQSLLFSQVAFDLKGYTLIAGASLNNDQINFERFAPSSLGKLSRNFDNQLAPRIALMKKLKWINCYTSISKGFSPPTTAELVPTGGAINLGLDAEKAISYELGIKGSINNIIYLDVNTFFLSLENTIVQRHNAFAGDYYTNAGSTSQKGLETFIQIHPFQNNGHFRSGNFSLSYTLYDFTYKNFKQQNNDFSGNKIPSVPANTVNAAFHLSNAKGSFINLNYFYCDKIFLNDANTATASSYQLLTAKAGISKQIRSFNFRITAGADNLLNVKYSLGNDINGFGGRYYNVASGRNYFVSLKVRFQKYNSSVI